MLQALAQHPLSLSVVLCFLGAGLVHETQRWLLPKRIPTAQIEALADELLTDFGRDAMDIAADHQERANWRSEPGEEGKWRRVKRLIQRRADMKQAG